MKVNAIRRLTTSILASSLLSSSLLLSGCGQSGPLYIPGNPSTMAIPPENRPEDREQQEEDAQQEQQESTTPTPDQ